MILAGAAVLAFTGCGPEPKGPAGAGGPTYSMLDEAIQHRIGDPATCVLLADRTTGKVVYRYGQLFNCTRTLPACDRPGSMSATDALALASTPGGRMTSCPSTPDGSRTVGWAEGRANSKSRDLVYSALMEGQTAMPGREIAARLDEAFAKAGL